MRIVRIVRQVFFLLFRNLNALESYKGFYCRHEQKALKNSSGNKSRYALYFLDDHEFYSLYNSKFQSL